MIEIVNRQRKHKLNLNQCRELGERALKAVGRDEREATIVFVSDRAIKNLNRKFRGKDYATDVLSFPASSAPFDGAADTSLGDVVISADRAAEQAKQNGLAFANEVEQLILHGLLHLCGHDHEADDGEMNRLELKLRRKLGI